MEKLSVFNLNLVLIASKQAFNIQTISLEKEVLKMLLEEKNPYIIEQTSKSATLKEYLEKFPCASLALLPIIVKDKVIGVLHVDTLLRHRFSPDEITLLSLVANQAGIASKMPACTGKWRKQRKGTA